MASDSDEEEDQNGQVAAYELRNREKRAQNLKLMHSLDLVSVCTILLKHAC